jgi:schlafen family protein
MHIAVDLNETDLLSRMRNFEDHMVERKTVKDEKDWKRAAVAFANSAPIGYPALLYIGVRDNGEIENPQKDLEEVAKKFNSQMQKVYPRIAYVPKVISSDGRQALAVIIPGSESRPHFAGPAYVRRGPESVDASEEQFAQLIAQRNSKAAFLLGWKGKNVTVFTRMGDDELAWPNDTCLVDCNQLYVSLQRYLHEPLLSFPLSRVEINFDNMKQRPQLEVTDFIRNAWKVGVEREVHQIVSQVMTRDGQLLLNHLLKVGKVESLRQLLPEITIDTQNEQMQIAVKHGLVRREQDAGRLHTFYLVNPDYDAALKKLLFQLLS